MTTKSIECGVGAGLSATAFPFLYRYLFGPVIVTVDEQRL